MAILREKEIWDGTVQVGVFVFTLPPEDCFFEFEAGFVWRQDWQVAANVH